MKPQTYRRLGVILLLYLFASGLTSIILLFVYLFIFGLKEEATVVFVSPFLTGLILMATYIYLGKRNSRGNLPNKKRERGAAP